MANDEFDEDEEANRRAELIEIKTGPSALAYQIEQVWKTVNIGPYLILAMSLLFSTELQQLASSVIPVSS